MAEYAIPRSTATTTTRLRQQVMVTPSHYGRAAQGGMAHRAQGLKRESALNYVILLVSYGAVKRLFSDCEDHEDCRFVSHSLSAIKRIRA